LKAARIQVSYRKEVKLHLSKRTLNTASIEISFRTEK